jgi:F-type H+-transporting ATPase subunit epsilon
MADRLTLEVATPTRLVLSEQVDEVVAPGSLGYFGVLPGHAPFLTTLGVGELTYRQNREERHLAVAGGFAEVRDDKVIILADTAEFPEEIDVTRAERARARAEQRLLGRGTETDIDWERVGRSLARAQMRLAAASRARSLTPSRG